MDVTFHNGQEFMKWARHLDRRHRERVLGLIDMLEASDRPLGAPHGRRISLDGELYELRSTSGHRVYYTIITEPQLGALILTQGNKDTQTQDIQRARSRQP